MFLQMLPTSTSTVPADTGQHTLTPGFLLLKSYNKVDRYESQVIAHAHQRLSHPQAYISDVGGKVLVKYSSDVYMMNEPWYMFIRIYASK